MIINLINIIPESIHSKVNVMNVKSNIDTTVIRLSYPLG